MHKTISRRQPGYIAVALCLVWPAMAQPPANREPEPSDINKRRAEWFNAPRAYPFGRIPQGARIKAIRDMERMLPRGGPRRLRVARPGAAASAALSSTQWTSIGPGAIGGCCSGRVWTIAVHPTDSNTVYIGTDGGGVWKTSDGGASWTPLTDDQPSLTIRSIALSPSNPNIVYAATGSSSEGDGAGGVDASAAGILKSTDGGNTWTQIAAPFVQSAYATSVNSLDVQPGGQVVLAATENSIYRSADGGATWNSVFTETSSYAEFTQVLFDPSNANHAFAAGVAFGGILQSYDGGQTWTLTNGQGANVLPISSFDYWTMALAPSAPNVLYAAGRLGINSSSGASAFYKSTDGGTNWSAIGIPANDTINYWGWSLRVHPTNPNLVLAGSLVLHATTDGGATWTDVADSVHVDQHAQVFSPDGSKLYIGNDGGVWSTTNPAAPPFTWTDLNAGITTALFYPGLSIHPSDVNTAFAGTQDNGTIYYQGLSGWQDVTCGDGGWTAIDFVQPQNIYSDCDYIEIVKSTSGGSGPWLPAQTGINTQDQSSFIPPLVMDPSNSQQLYFGTYRLYQTSNGAGSWTAISGDLTAGGPYGESITAIAVAPSDSNTVYTGSRDGQINVSHNALSGASATWANVTNTLPNRAIAQIAVDPQNPLTAYAALSGYSTQHVFKTTDGGADWTVMSGNLPDIPANDIVIDPDQTTTLYLATDIGVFRSLDSGTSWLPFGAGMPRVVVSGIRVHRPTRTLRAGTYGRGAWDLSIPLTGQVFVTISSNTTGAPFQLEDGTTYQAPVTLAWTAGAQHTVTWLATLSGQTGGRYVFQSWSDGGSNPRTITVPSSAATYTANIQLQFQLTIALTPAGSGSITANPASPDGFYNAGTNVTITAVPANGYSFLYFSGDVPGTTANQNPQTISMTTASAVTANFSCDYTFFYNPLLPATVGAGPSSGFLYWQTGAGCMWSFSGIPAWMSMGVTSGTGSGWVPYTISLNSGSARSGILSFAAGTDYLQQIDITQQGQGQEPVMPSVVSTAPTSGTGPTQTFTVQFYDVNGFGHIYPIIILAETPQTLNSCAVQYDPVSRGFYLSGDALGTLGPIAPGSSGTLQNSNCLLDGSRSSVSGSGDSLTVTVALTFQSSFSGVKAVIAVGDDVTGGTINQFGPQQLVGTWTVTGSATLTGITLQTNPPGLQFTVDGGAPQIAPQTVSLSQGSHTIAVAGTQAGGAGTQYAFSSWSDSGAVSHSITVGASAATYTATFQTQYQLTTLASPAAGGTVTPASGAYYNSGANVPIAATPATGYIFTGWTGSVAIASSASTTVTMRAPETVVGGFTLPGFTINPNSANVGASGGTSSVTVTTTVETAAWTALNNNTSFLTITSGASGTGSGTVDYSVAANTSTSSRTGTLTIAGQTFTITQAGLTTAGLGFYPVTPCRVADTRASQGFKGQFGPPSMSPGQSRSFIIPSSGCNIPATAQAYSLNVTVVPAVTLGYLTIWPTGQTQPYVSTLNSLNGAILANAAIVPAGSGGAVSVYVTDVTDVIIDIDGYFAPPTASALAFYPVTPCRVADTRNPIGPFGGPSLGAGTARTFTVPQSSCGIPATAQAYSLNMTVVPPGPLEYLSVWPAGKTQPYVSTLNALQGQIAANAAIVPAGTSGAVSVFVSDPSNVIIDINGYFAPPGSPGALYFYPLTPCRIADTRDAAGTFGGPSAPAGGTRTFPILSSSCGLPSTAQGYSLNMTVVPTGSLFYLTTWPTGQSLPVVSTLNDLQGQIVANAAIVPAGASGGISVYVSDATNLIIDINGYFGQ